MRDPLADHFLDTGVNRTYPAPTKTTGGHRVNGPALGHRRFSSHGR
jgi:hypothetical protein